VAVIVALILYYHFVAIVGRVALSNFASQIDSSVIRWCATCCFVGSMAGIVWLIFTPRGLLDAVTSLTIGVGIAGLYFVFLVRAGAFDRLRLWRAKVTADPDVRPPIVTADQDR
jgi:hypothetical protein